MIPRRFHWIWLGDRPLPSRFATWIDGWLGLHPGWEHTLWTDANRPVLRNEEQFCAGANYAQKSDVLRYELVLEHGGVYVDCDVECRRNLEPLIAGHSAFISRGVAGPGVGAAVFGAVAGHPWVQAIVDGVPEAFEDGTDQVDQSGSGLLTPVTLGRADVTIFPSGVVFSTAAGGGRPNPAERHPEAYAIHHWSRSWHAEAAERVLPIAEIDQLIPRGAQVLTITATFGPLELADRVVTHLYPREAQETDHPADDQAAIRAFERVRTPTLGWVVLHRWAFWWLKAYPEFFVFLESISTRVERRRWVVAYELKRA